MSVAVDVIRKNLRPPLLPISLLKSEVSCRFLLSFFSISTNKCTDLITACWAQNANDRPDFQEIMTTLRGLTAHAPVQSYDTSAAVRVDAPSGMVYLVSTVCSTLLFYLQCIVL